MPDNKIGLEAIFENEKFQSGISEYNRSISDADANTAETGSHMSDIWNGLADVGFVAFTAIAAGIAAMTAELYLAVTAAIDAEDAMARVEFVVANVADRTGVTTDEVDDLASSLSKVLPIDDEVIAQAIAMGLTFDGVNEDNLQPLISAAADLAAWTGSDLPSAMKNLSLSITDPDRAMRLFKEANITLTEEQKKTLKSMGDMGDTAGATAFILDQLAQKGIIGLGEVMGDTAKGKFTIMQTAIGNLQESLGEGLLDSLKGVFDVITDIANSPQVIDFFTNLGEIIGSLASYFIAVVQDGDFLNDWLSHLPSSIQPAVQAVGEFVAALIENVPKAFQWFIDNKPIIIGILAAIGVAMGAFATTTVSAAITTLSAVAPIIVAMLAVGAVVALIAKAWQEDWGGIQGKVKQAWAQMKPVFDKLQAWLKVNLPKALKVLADFWDKTLLPAIKTATVWIVDNVLPVLVELVQWLGENVPKAIKATSDFFTKTLIPAIKTVGDWINNTLIPTLQDMRDWFQVHVVNGIKTLVTTISGILTTALNTISNIWQNVLLPALTAVWNFINNNIIPIFNAVSNLMNAVVGLAVRVLAGLWQNVLAPALQSVWNWISNNIIPIFHSVSDTMNGVLSTATTKLRDLWINVLLPAIQKLWDKLEPFRVFLAGALKNAFQGVWDIIQKIITKIDEWAEAIRNLELPAWLTPGSPTPFELGLKGINEQLNKLSNAALPAIRHQMEILGTVRDVAGANGRSLSSSVSNSNQSTRNYLFGPNFNLPGPNGLIETLQGLS